MNSLSRYFIVPEEWQSDRVFLRGDEAHHCVRVLRAKLGDSVEVFDGCGGCAKGEISNLSKQEVEVTLIGEKQIEPPLQGIELIQTIPKGGNMEWIIQKAVELGVQTLVPVITEHSVVKHEQSSKKLEKWQRVALEACKQCGQNYLPTIQPVQKLSNWMKDSRDFTGVEVVAALDERSEPLRDVLTTRVNELDSIRVLIGPEGDFSIDEYNYFYSEKMEFASLGELVLRVETATLYCISAIRYQFGSSLK